MGEANQRPLVTSRYSRELFPNRDYTQHARRTPLDIKMDKLYFTFRPLAENYAYVLMLHLTKSFTRLSLLTLFQNSLDSLDHQYYYKISLPLVSTRRRARTNHSPESAVGGLSSDNNTMLRFCPAERRQALHTN
jgi:hypothetical protein